MMRHTQSRFQWRKFVLATVSAIIAVYLILLIPEGDYRIPVNADQRPFVWDRDQLWASLESLYNQARAIDHDSLAPAITAENAEIDRLLKTIENDSLLLPEANVFDTLESVMFRLAAQTAACPEKLPKFIDLYSAMRFSVKNQSRRWDMNRAETRRRMYRLLYGGRAAVDEMMLQLPIASRPALITGHDEPSTTPQANLLGVTIHSGDILVSRGGAPTSALIARGNDYPGNFSHVALAYVDDQTGKISIIESHIECGVSISDVETYLKDTKLRVLVLRLRSDLPQMVENPLLPHRAAAAALSEARSRHIAYDFEMDCDHHDKLFCSEVASAPYDNEGVRLWMGISHISSMRLRIWLAALGVRHFQTQEPSDLEYDPQLRVVAEWRNPELLAQDHFDNAVLDALLEGGDSTKTLEYDRLMLPFARIVKGYSLLINLFGSVGPVPEGMSATAGLRVDRFSRKHEAIRGRLTELAIDFQQQQGYFPPYWVLVKLAEQAKSESEASSH